MFTGYLYHQNGTYHSKIYLDTIQQFHKLIFSYKNITPKIMITENDMSIMESEAGEIVYPNLTEDRHASLLCQFPPVDPNIDFEAVLSSYKDKYENVRKSAFLTQKLKKEFLQAEYLLLAVGARDDVNLFERGYLSAELALDDVIKITP